MNQPKQVHLSHELKKLQTRLANEQATYTRLLTEKHSLEQSIADRLETVNNQITNCLKELKFLETSIAKLKTNAPAPIVTEHALLRYFERVLGYNLEDIRTKILSPKMVDYIDQFESGVFPDNESEPHFQVIVKNRTIVSLKAKETDKE